MRKFRKFLAIPLALTLLFAIAVPVLVLAAEEVIQPSSKDTFILEEIPNTNHDEHPYGVYLLDVDTNCSRTLLEFSLGDIPGGATIDGASLELYYYNVEAPSADPVGLTVTAFKAEQPTWVEDEATWNKYTAGDNWGTAGGDYDSVPPPGSANATMPAGYGWVSWNVTQIVDDAYTGAIDVELLLKFVDETVANPGHNACFRDGEYAVDPAKRPKLTVDYTVSGTPTIEVRDATNVAQTTATLNSILTWDGGGSCNVSFQYSPTANWSTCANTTWVPGYTTGQTPFVTAENLTANTLFYFQASARGVSGNSTSGNLTFTTEGTLLLPTNFKAYPSFEEVVLAWTKGSGATNTMIRFRTDAYPSDNESGTKIYEGPLNSYTHTGLISGTTYFYSVWGISGDNCSANYTTVMATALAGAAPAEMPPPPDEPEAYYQDVEETRLSNFPGYDHFNYQFDELNVPRATGWFMLGVFGLLISFIGVLIVSTSMLAAFITAMFVIGICVVIELFPAWMLVLLIILALGAIKLGK